MIEMDYFGILPIHKFSEEAAFDWDKYYLYKIDLA